MSSQEIFTQAQPADSKRGFPDDDHLKRQQGKGHRKPQALISPAALLAMAMVGAAGAETSTGDDPPKQAGKETAATETPVEVTAEVASTDATHDVNPVAETAVDGSDAPVADQPDSDLGILAPSHIGVDLLVTDHQSVMADGSPLQVAMAEVAPAAAAEVAPMLLAAANVAETAMPSDSTSGAANASADSPVVSTDSEFLGHLTIGNVAAGLAGLLAIGVAGKSSSDPGDTAPPVAPNAVLRTDTGSSTTDGITHVGVVSVTGVETGAKWEYTTNGGSQWIVGNGASFTLGAGSYAANAVQVRQTDAAGNTSSVGRIGSAINVDASVAAPELALATDSGFSSSDGITMAGVVNVTGLELGAAWEYSLDAGTHWTAGSGSSFTLKEGAYAAASVQVRQTDVAGNVSSASSILATVDTTTAQVVSITSLASSALALGASATLTIIFDGVVTGFTATDLLDAKGGTFTGLTSTDGGTSWTVVFTPNADKLGPASIKVAGDYGDVAGNLGQASASVSVAYMANATVTDGYVSNANLYLDVDGNGTISAGDVLVGATAVDGSLGVALSAGQDRYGLLATGGTDISTGLPFTGLMKAPAGSTVLSPLTTLLAEVLKANTSDVPFAEKLAAAQSKLLAALSLPAGVDLTSFDPLEVAVTQGTTASAAQRAVALDVQAKSIAVANLLVAGSAALQGASTLAGGVSADSAGSAMLGALVNQIINAELSASTINLSSAETLSSLMTSAATDAGVASGLDATKQAANIGAASTTLALTNQAIDQAISEAATAQTNAEFLASLSKAVAIQVIAQGVVSTSLKAGSTEGLPTDAASLTTQSQAIDLSQLQLTSTQSGQLDTTVARVVDISADAQASAAGVKIVFAVQMSEGVAITQGVPTVTVTRSMGGTLTLDFDATLSSSTRLVFSVLAPNDASGTVAFTSFNTDGVTFSDTAGNTTSSIMLPATLAAENQKISIFDTKAPEVAQTLTTDDVGTMTGALKNGATTDDTALLLSGTNEAGAQVDVYDGRTLLGSATVSGTTWRYSATVVDGTTHQFSARATDAAGNTSVATSAFTVVGDTTAPKAGALVFGGLEDTGSAQTPAITRDGTFSLAVSGNESGSTLGYEVSIDGGATWGVTTASQTGLADGSYNFRAKATDAAGNSATGNAISVTVDNSAPASGTLAFVNLTDSGASSADGITQDATFSLAVSGNESGSTLGYEVSIDGGATWGVTTASQTGLADGSYQFRTKVSDTAGNTAFSASTSVRVDTTADAGADLAVSVGDPLVSKSEKTAVAYTVAGLDSGATAVVIFSDGSKSVTGVGGVADLSTLSDGSITVSVNASDAAGNTASGSGATTMLDTKPPTVTLVNTGGFTDQGNAVMGINFSEAVAGFDISDIHLVNGVASAFAAIDASHYTALITPSSSTTPINMMLDVAVGAAVDGAGNASSAAAQILHSVLFGTTGNDVLTVGPAQDTVFLGGGNDTVVLAAVTGSTTTATDKVFGFRVGDHLDLSALLGKHSSGAGYTAIALADTGAGFVELKNLTLTPGTVSGTTLVKFNVYFDAATIKNSKIEGALIDLVYDYSKVTSLGVTSSTYADPNGGDPPPVWPVIQKNAANGQIVAATDFSSDNPIVDLNGKVMGVTLTVNSVVSSFSVGLESVAAGGKTAITTADKVSHNVDVGVTKTAGIAAVSTGVLQVIIDTGELRTVGDNQLHLVSIYDSAQDVTHLQARYDTNSTFGAGNTSVSNVIAMDFDGDVTGSLVPASLLYGFPPP